MKELSPSSLLKATSNRQTLKDHARGGKHHPPRDKGTQQCVCESQTLLTVTAPPPRMEGNTTSSHVGLEASSPNETAEELWDYRNVTLSSTDLVSLVFLPLNAVLALVGNSLSLAVFTRSRLRGAPSSGYLAALAVADTGSAVMAPIVNSGAVFGPFPEFLQCNALAFLSDVFLFLSPWFVVCFTAERYVSVCHPLRAPQILARLRERRVVAFITIFACAFSCVPLIGQWELFWNDTISRWSCYLSAGHFLSDYAELYP